MSKTSCPRIIYWRVDPCPPWAASTLAPPLLYQVPIYVWICFQALSNLASWYIFQTLSEYYTALIAVTFSRVLVSGKSSPPLLFFVKLSWPLCFTYTFCPPYPLVPYLTIQPTADRKYLERKIPKCSQKQNLNLLQVGNYLHSIYIVLGSICNLKMIWSIHPL